MLNRSVRQRHARIIRLARLIRHLDGEKRFHKSVRSIYFLRRRWYVARCRRRRIVARMLNVALSAKIRHWPEVASNIAAFL